MAGNVYCEICADMCPNGLQLSGKKVCATCYAKSKGTKQSKGTKHGELAERGLRIDQLLRENADLRKEIRILKHQAGLTQRAEEPVRIVKRVITPPEERWDGYSH